MIGGFICHRIFGTAGPAMNSQSQKPSSGSKGGRSLTGDPPYESSETARTQSFDSGKPVQGSAGPSSSSSPGSAGLAATIGARAASPAGGDPSVAGSGFAKPVNTPSLGGYDTGKSRNPGAGKSSGVSSLAASGSTDTTAAKPRQTGTEALIAETEDTLGK